MPSGGHSRCKGLEMGSGLLQWRKRKWAVGLGTNDGGVGWGLAECGKGAGLVFNSLDAVGGLCATENHGLIHVLQNAVAA